MSEKVLDSVRNNILVGGVSRREIFNISNIRQIQLNTKKIMKVLELDVASSVMRNDRFNHSRMNISKKESLKNSVSKVPNLGRPYLVQASGGPPLDAYLGSLFKWRIFNS
ncbi:hypothetical protein LR48_Vigan11g071700 [Vigna angularis]|uniref:Uncharacterized protein n=1 Tax=Phaseolus angularis TaxID=3914 RepID=A0A0L9VSE3_PHAAN|nr:hypothetical protein LR48_Vigan11g071700 [Vigna angularis]